MADYPFEILIKSFVRFGKLGRLIESIERYYPGAVIRIADDSPESRERDEICARIATVEGCHVYRLPFNVGISVGRNFLVRQVRAPYFVLLDDDFEFTPATSLNRLRMVLDGDDRCLLAAGAWLRHGRSLDQFHGHAEIRGKEIIRYQYGSQAPVVRVNGVQCVPCRLTHNFFMGSTTLFRAHGIRWDERLKILEHTWFFLNLPSALRMYYVPGVVVAHHPGNDGSFYEQFRFDRDEAHRVEEIAEARIRPERVMLYESRWRRILTQGRRMWAKTQGLLRSGADRPPARRAR